MSTPLSPISNYNHENTGNTIGIMNGGTVIYSPAPSLPQEYILIIARLTAELAERTAKIQSLKKRNKQLKLALLEQKTLNNLSKNFVIDNEKFSVQPMGVDEHPAI